SFVGVGRPRLGSLRLRIYFSFSHLSLRQFLESQSLAMGRERGDCTRSSFFRNHLWDFKRGGISRQGTELIFPTCLPKHGDGGGSQHDLSLGDDSCAGRKPCGTIASCRGNQSPVGGGLKSPPLPGTWSPRPGKRARRLFVCTEFRKFIPRPAS